MPPRPKYNRSFIIILKRRTRPCRRPRRGLGQNTIQKKSNNTNTKEEDLSIPPTPALLRPKYNRILIILILKKRTRPCRRPRPGLSQNTIEI